MLTDDQIKKFRERARQAGYSESQIAAEIQRKAKETQTPAPQVAPQVAETNRSALVQQQPKVESSGITEPEKPGGLGGFLRSLVEPGLRYGRFVGEAGAMLLETPKRIGLEREFEELQKTPLTEERVRRQEEIAAELQQISKPTFMKEKQYQEMLEPGGIAREAIKSTAGAASYLVPGGTTVKGAVAAGATAGALYGLSEGEEFDTDKILAGALGGAVTGGAFKSGTMLLGKTKRRLGQWFTESAQKSITRATPTAWANAVRDKGIDLNQVTAKLVKKGIAEKGQIVKGRELGPLLSKKGVTYEDLLGNIEQRGSGGTLGKELRKAEQSIQEALKKTKIKNIGIDDIVKELQDEAKSLADLPGNEGSIDALNAFIDGLKTKYPTGITPAKLLELKRVADSAFGASVADETTGSATAQAQKMFANWGRSKLKQLFPQIKDGLDTQSELLTLQPILLKAQGTANTMGSEIRVGSLKGKSLTDLLNPLNLLDTALANDPKLASRIIAKSGESVKSIKPDQRAKVAADIVVKGFERTARTAAPAGAVATTETMQPEAEMQGMQGEQMPETATATDQEVDQLFSDVSSGKTQEMPQQEQPFGGRTKQEVLYLGLQSGLTMDELKEVAEIYDLIAPTTGAGARPTSSAGAARYDLAQSGLRALEDVERLITQDPNVLTKQLVPGQWLSREYDASAFQAAEALLRMRSGAAVPEQEVRRYMTKIMPAFGDDKKTIDLKLKRLRQNYEDIVGSSGEIQETPIMQ